MKWYNAKRFNESVEKLAHLYSKYNRVVMDDNMKTRPRYEEVKEEDLKSAGNLLKEIDTDAIIEELEEYLDSDLKRNQTVFNICDATLSKGMCWLALFREKDVSMFNCIPFTFKRYTNEPWTPDAFCRYVALSTRQKTRNVQDKIKRLKEVYGIESDTQSCSTLSKNEKKKASNFSDIIQYEDKERLLKRLHELIDGRGGADVGSVILQAWLTNLITRKPTRKEFESEFKTRGCWTAIYKYLDDNNQNALDRANRIVFFD